MVSKGHLWDFWNGIARLHSQVMTSTCENSLTASRYHAVAYLDASQPTSKVSILKKQQQQ